MSDCKTLSHQIATLAEIATFGSEMPERRVAYNQLLRLAGEIGRMEAALDDIAGGALEDEQAAFDWSAETLEARRWEFGP